MKKSILSILFLTIFFKPFAQNYNWAFRIGGNGANDINNSVSVDGSGNVYVAGAFEGTVDFDPNPSINFPLTSAGSKDIFFAKYSSTGALIWANRIGSTGIDEAKFIRVNNVTNEVYLAGVFQNTVDFNPASAVANLTSAGGYDVFFARYSSTGTLQYSRKIGNANNESISAMAINSNGEFIISGNFSGTVDFDPNPAPATFNMTATGTDMFIARYSSTFTFMNAYRNAGVSITDINYENSNAIFLTGNVSGSSFDIDFTTSTALVASTSGSLSDVYVSKYDASFAHQWSKLFSGTTGNRYGRRMALTGSNLIVTGYHFGDVDLDPSLSASLTAASVGSDFFVSILSNSTGTFVNGFNIGGANDEIANDVCTDNSGNIYLAGVFTGTTDFDPSANTTLLTSNGNDDIFFAKYSPTGSFLFANKIGASGNQGASEIALYAPDDLYIAGNISGTGIDFDPSSNSAIISSLGGVDGVLAKYKSCPDPLNPVSQASQNNTCAFQSVTLTLSSGFIGGGANWVWYSGSCGTTSVGTGTSIVVSPSVNTSYFVRAEGGCLTSPGMCSGANPITAYPLPTLTVATTNTLLCAGSTASLTLSGAINYSINSNSLPSNIAVVNPTTTTTYTIIGEDSGCNSTSLYTQSVTVCSFINEQSKNIDINVYPNPSNGTLKITSTNAETLLLINELGSVISTIEINSRNNYSCELKGLQSGIYIIQGETIRKKIVVLD